MTTQTPQNFDTPSGTYTGSELAPETPRPTGHESATGTGSAPDASVKDRAVAVGGTVKDEAVGVAGEVTTQARDLMGQAKGQVREQVATQRGRAADLVQGFADDLEKMAGSSDTFAGALAGQAADQIRGVQQYLRTDANPLDDLRSFARRRPGTFLLGALAAGILVGRATRGTVAARQQSEQRELGQIAPARTVGPTYTNYRTPAYTGYQTSASTGHLAQAPAPEIGRAHV